MNDFNYEEISRKTDEELKKILSQLSLEPIINDYVQHRAIIQAMVVNQIIFQRHIDGVEKRAQLGQWMSMGIAVLALVVSIISVVIS